MEIKVETRMVPVRGITLRWEKRQRMDVYVDLPHTWFNPPRGTVLESGEVFIKMSLLEELADQGMWDSSFGSPFIISSSHVGWALEQAGFAVQETRGGYHRTRALVEFMNANGYDFELEDDG